VRSVVVAVALAACSLEHGAPATMMKPDDAAVTDDGPSTIDDAPIDGRMIDAAIAMIDAKVCPPAAPGCSLFSCAGSTSCYYACGTATTGQVSWTTARNTCTTFGMGCIVTINSQAEQDCIVARTNPVYPDNVWFGLRQSSTGAEPGGGWAWECPPSTYVYPAWGMSEPNNQGGSEDCGILATGGDWNDAECTTQSRYVCEL
jgi:hypothetical protein